MLMLKYIFLFLPLLSFGQDSLQTVPVPRWQLWRMVHEVKLSRVCDSLRTELTKEVNLGMRFQLAADSALTVRTRQVNNLLEQNKTWEHRLENQFTYTKELKKENRKLKWVAGGSIVASVLLLLIAH